MPPLRILTWHVHGSYLYYLTQANHEFYLPVKPGKPEGYGGRAGSFPWGDNVHDVPADRVRELDFDVILYQSRKNYLEDQYEILSARQRALPRIYLEHDPPREVPTDTKHIVDDPNMLLVHVTHFNDLMWDNGRTPTRVIDHGVVVPEDVRYTGELERGVVVVNGLRRRGRRLGADVFQRVRQEVPLDLVGMFSDELDGVANLPQHELAAFEAPYRFFFNPIRYTSLGLSICEAMMIGMPVVGLATTELVTVIENGVSGYVDTNVSHLIEHMQRLLRDRAEAQRLGEGARRYAQERFGMERFKRDWDAVFREAASNGIYTGFTLPAVGASQQEGYTL
ncbi:MAG TPA: glycosyltransferase [Chloroflexia bacterium]|nr:glycosyltransferase [Chloroflexia bacterium]